MTYEEATQTAKTKAAQLNDAQLIEMYEYAENLKGNLDAKLLIKDAALDNLWERHEEAMNQYARDIEANDAFITARGLKAAHHSKGSERRAELQALANRVLAELGDLDSLSINLNDREQFLSASHRPVAKQLEACSTTWRR